MLKGAYKAPQGVCGAWLRIGRRKNMSLVKIEDFKSIENNCMSLVKTEEFKSIGRLLEQYAFKITDLYKLKGA